MHFAADILGSRRIFGGLEAHPDYFSATTETIDVAISFDSLLFEHLEELPRHMAELSAGMPYIASILPTAKYGQLFYSAGFSR